MTRRNAMLLMAAVVLARSTSFLFSKHLMSGMEPLNVLAVRFILAFGLLVLLFFRRFRSLDRGTFRAGLILGVVYTGVMVFEMYGLRLVETGTSSFIENSAVVFVVLFELIFFHRKPTRRVLLAIAVTLVGLGLLTLSESSGGLNPGLIYTFIALLLYALALMLTAHLSRDCPDPLMIGILQVGFMGLFSCILSFIMETPRLPADGTEWLMILLLAAVCSCFGFTLQPTAQKYLEPETAGLLTTLNPLGAFLIGVIFAGESLSLSRLLGSLLILGGIIICVMPGKEAKA